MKKIYTTSKVLFIALFLGFSMNSAFSQIGIDNENPNENSSLDLGATDRGLLPNRLTNNERTGILEPSLGPDEKGMWVYDTDQNLFYFWDGNAWVAMSSGSLSGSGMEGQVTLWGAGNAVTGTDQLYWDFDYQRLGIGTTFPNAALTIDNDADIALKVTNSGAWAISEFLVGIERTINPIGGTDLLQLRVPFGSDTDFQFLQCNYGNEQVLKINGDGHLNANTIGLGTDNAFARFNIYDDSYDILMNVIGGGTPSVIDYMINFERDDVPYSGIDMVRLKLPDGSPDDTQFMEFERGQKELIQINGNGDIVLKNGASFVGTPNGLNPSNVELDGGDVIIDNGQVTLQSNGDVRAWFASTFQSSWINLHNDSEERTVYLRSGSGNAGGAMTLYSADGSARAALGAGSTGGSFTMYDSDGTSTVFMSANNAGGGYLNLKKEDGTSAITLTSDHSGTGDSRLTVDEIRLNGGADFAEFFDVIPTSESDVIEPGMLVSINPDDPGKLMPCSDAYDKKVAGIISGANGVKPGLMMGQDNSIASGDHPVALSGRVYVKATNLNGDINPGDFLTTSSKCGYAMKVKKMKKAKGAIIGKAMTGLDIPDGYVLVLVTLQ